MSRARWAETQLGYAFNDLSFLDLALTHRSASKANNERLEYLGDSFLNFVIAKRLFDLRPEDTEGDLSRARAALVKEETLAAIGQRLGVDAQLTLGPGELRSGGAQRAAILADAVEALLGAAAALPLTGRVSIFLRDIASNDECLFVVAPAHGLDDVGWQRQSAPL